MRRQITIIAAAVAVLSISAFEIMSAQAPAVCKQVALVKAAKPREGDQLGHSIALSADGMTMATGVPMDGSGDNATFSAGAVYVYTRSGERWTQQSYVKPAVRGADDQFGSE